MRLPRYLLFYALGTELLNLMNDEHMALHATAAVSELKTSAPSPAWCVFIHTVKFEQVDIETSFASLF